MSQKIEIYRGVSYPVTYNHKDAAGASVPLTGKRLYFTVKLAAYDTSTDDSTAVIKKTITTHTNAALGITDFVLTDVDTYIEPGKYFYTFLIEDIATNNTEPPTVLGTLTIKPQQTNRQVVNG